jgi:pyruvate dehydrogenase E1 component
VDAPSIVVAALQALAKQGEVKQETVKEAFDRLRINDPTAVRDVAQTGGDA